MAAVLAAGFPARAGERVHFATRPTVQRVDDRYKISFTLSQPADVEVSVVDGAGNGVRHVAAGVIGVSSPDRQRLGAEPSPLQPSSLAQEVMWDGKDDLGRPAFGGNALNVRVRAGIEPRLEKMLGSSPGGFYGGCEAISVSPQGELYALNCEVFKFGRVEMIVLDRDGNYLRTIVPYPAGTPKERTESVGHLLVDSQRVPILFSGHSGSVYPLVCGMRSQTMAWHPKGYLIAVSSIGSARENGPGRYLLAFHPQGGAPEGVSFVGPEVCEPRGFLGGDAERDNRGMDRVAVSPDGEWIYVAPNYVPTPKKTPPRAHGIYRCKWSDKTIGQLWLGRPAAGAGDDEFNDPQGIAVDATGRLFICDRNNNRVKVYASDGKLLGQFAVELPEQIARDPKSGRMFILSRPASARADSAKLLAFEPFANGTARKAFEQAIASPVRAIALDVGATPLRLWVVEANQFRRSGKLVPFVVLPDRVEAGAAVKIPSPLDTPSFLAATPDGSSVIVREHLDRSGNEAFVKIDVDSGKMEPLPLRGCDIAIDAKGNYYTQDPGGGGAICRYDPQGRPLPFAGTQTNRVASKFMSMGPDMAMRGLCVDLRGNIYVSHYARHIIGANLDVYSPEGKLVKHDVVAGLGSSDSGVGVDAAGNLYVGVNVKDVDRPLPEPFAGRVPALNWIWWKDPAFQRPAPWWYIYCNTYLFHMGQVIKFGPEGGTIYGAQRTEYDLPIASPGTELEKAPAGAAAFKTAYLTRDAKIVGAKWHYAGVGSIGASYDGPLPDPGCTCLPSHLTVDPFGRTFAPNCFLFAVDLIDPSGRLIRRIGHYGNNDDPAAGIPLLQPTACAVANDRLFISDTGNRRVLVVRLAFAAEASCVVNQ